MKGVSMMQWHLKRKFPPGETRHGKVLRQRTGECEHGSALSGKSFLPAGFREGLLLFQRVLSVVGDRLVDMLVQVFSWICSMVIFKRHRLGKAPLRLSLLRVLTSQGLSEARIQTPAGGAWEKASCAPSCLLSAHSVERHSRRPCSSTGHDDSSLPLSNGARNDKHNGWRRVDGKGAGTQESRGVAFDVMRSHGGLRAGVDDVQLLRRVRMGSSGTWIVPADGADGIMTFTINH